MRTTVELPANLMKDAKARAASRGESLMTLLTRAVAAELGQACPPQGRASRVELPLFGDAKGERVKVSRDQIARTQAEDDIVPMRRSKRRGVD